MGKTSALRGTNQQIELIGSHSNLARIEKSAQLWAISWDISRLPKKKFVVCLLHSQKKNFLFVCLLHSHAPPAGGVYNTLNENKQVLTLKQCNIEAIFQGKGHHRTRNHVEESQNAEARAWGSKPEPLVTGKAPQIQEHRFILPVRRNNCHMVKTLPTRDPQSQTVGLANS